MAKSFGAAAARPAGLPSMTGSGTSHGIGDAVGAATAPTGISPNSRRGLVAADVCRTAFVTTSETSRHASSAWAPSIPHARNVCSAIRRASDTMTGSAGKTRSRASSSAGSERATRIAMSSSISPGTDSSAARAIASAPPAAAALTARHSMPSASSSV